MSKLRKGTRVFLSKQGHKGFFYPDDRDYLLLYDVDAIDRHWIGDTTKRAGVVPQNALFVSGSPDVNITVWFDKSIRSSS